MAVYRVDFVMSLYHTEYVNAQSPEQAENLAEAMLDNDGFVDDLFDAYSDPQQTDWIAENVEVGVSDYTEESWEPTVYADGTKRTEHMALVKALARLADFDGKELEREFFTVYADTSGVKHLKYLGYTTMNDGEWDDVNEEGPYRVLSYGTTVLLQKVDKELYDFLLSGENFLYTYDCAEKLAEQALGFHGEGRTGTYLNLSDVDEQTPCGIYWCYSRDIDL